MSGGKSSSSTSTYNTDARMAIGNGGAGISGNNSSIAITDGGIVSRALDTVDMSNAIGAEGYKKLLDTTDNLGERQADGFSQLIDAAADMFNKSEGLIGQTQKSVADAYSTAQADKAGGFDQKTIVMLAAVAAVAVVAIGRKG